MLPFVQRNPGGSRHVVFTLLSAALLCVVIGVGLSSCGSNAGSGSGSAQNPTPTTQAQVQKCGKVQTNPRGVVLKATDAKQAEDCFWQAFQKCSPASLVYTLAGVDGHNSYVHYPEQWRSLFACRCSTTHDCAGATFGGQDVYLCRDDAEA